MQNKTAETREPNARGGVKTPEGKAITRYNAQKHAILRETITEYEKADAEAIFNELTDSLNPQGRFQELLVETIASNAIRLQRIAKAEAELIKEALDPSSPNLSFGGYNPKIKHQVVSKMELYARYQTATENRLYRSMGMLRELKRYEK